MSLNADTLLDRINLKQQLHRWRVAAIVIGVIAIFVCVGKAFNLSPIKSDYIARITIDGIITDDPKLEKLINEVSKDRHAKAVFVRFDTPGGSAVGGQELYLNLRKLSAKKPVVAVMRGMAASAGYMAALGTDHIVAREATITGSIGVLMETFEATELAEKLGIKPIVVKSGPYKASPNPLEKYTSEQNAVIQAVIKDFFNWFVDIVAERRKLPRATAEKLADGRIYTGRQALAEKLVDELGGEEEATQWLLKNKKIAHVIDVEDVKPEEDAPSLLEQLNQIANGKFGANVLLRLDGLNAIWQPNPL